MGRIIRIDVMHADKRTGENEQDGFIRHSEVTGLSGGPDGPVPDESGSSLRSDQLQRPDLSGYALLN